MKITASRKDDILRRKAEYETKRKAYKEASDKAYNDYSGALNSAFEPSIEEIKSALGADADNLDIQMSQDYGSLRGPIYIRVNISNENYALEDPNSALRWSWSAYINEKGEVKKESSSWSGLEATTFENIEDLKKTARQLEIINNLDWERILNVQVPKYSDYIPDIENPEYEDFDSQLLEAELNDAVGQPVLLRAANGSGRYYRGPIYIGILRDSNTQYTVFEVPGRLVSEIQENGSVQYNNKVLTSISELVDIFKSTDHRVRKSTLLSDIVEPIETVQY